MAALCYTCVRLMAALCIQMTRTANREVQLNFTELEYLCLLVDEMARGAQMPIKKRCECVWREYVYVLSEREGGQGECVYMVGECDALMPR